MAPISQEWPSDRAILLVHGVGNAQPGDYADLVAALKAPLGDEAATFAVYELFYDFINDWFAQKTKFAEILQRAKALFKVEMDDDPELADTISDYAGDVLWPVLSSSARAAVREAYLLQLKQIVLDGINSEVPARRQHLTIIAHSLGCFYTYEALHAAATRRTHALLPSQGVQFDNVILMAAPIQLIRTIGDALGKAVPRKKDLSTFAPEGLRLPFQVADGEEIPSARNWVSITGELDPIGGFFFRKRANWAYTAIEGQESIIDPQTLLDDIRTRGDLARVLKSSLSATERPRITINNPHSWAGYVTRHEEELRQWLVA